MTWMETKLAARAVVHSTFERTARYFASAPLVGDGAEVSVRVHGDKVFTGDLDREGYSQIVEDVERILFLRTQAEQYSVQRNGYVRMDDTNVVYRLDLLDPSQDSYTLTFQATRVQL